MSVSNPVTNVLVKFSGYAISAVAFPDGESGNTSWQLKSSNGQFAVADGGTRTGKLEPDFLNSNPTVAMIWLNQIDSVEYVNIAMRTSPSGFYRYHSLRDFERETKKAVVSLELYDSLGFFAVVRRATFLRVDEAAGVKSLVFRAVNSGNLVSNISNNELLTVQAEFRGRRGKKTRSYTPAVAMRGNMQVGAMRRLRGRLL